MGEIITAKKDHSSMRIKKAEYFFPLKFREIQTLIHFLYSLSSKIIGVFTKFYRCIINVLLLIYGPHLLSHFAPQVCLGEL